MIYNAKELRDIKETKLANEVGLYSTSPCLAIIQIGNNPESGKYVNNKLKALERVGMSYRHIHSNELLSTEDILSLIEGLNEDNSVHGIMVQLPLPKHLDTRRILDKIDPVKDVDGLSSYSLGAIALGQVKQKATHIPCTVAGVLDILKDLDVKDFRGSNIVVLGKGITSGLPLTHYLIQEGANVVNLSSRCSEEDRYKYLENADIVISCTGVPNLIDVTKVPLGCVLVNVGMSVNEQGKLVGDYDPVLADELGFTCTSIINCTGIMTVQNLLNNLMDAYLMQK